MNKSKFLSIIFLSGFFNLCGMELQFSLPKIMIGTIDNKTSKDLTVIDQQEQQYFIPAGAQQQIMIEYHASNQTDFVRLLFGSFIQQSVSNQYSLQWKYSYPNLYVEIVGAQKILTRVIGDVRKLPLDRKIVIIIDIIFPDDNIKHAKISLVPRYARVGKEEID